MRIGTQRITKSDQVSRSMLTATTTAQLATAVGKSTRVMVQIFNNGTVPVYVGDAAVSTTNFEAVLQPGDLYTEHDDLGELYIRTGSGTALCAIKDVS